jgi:hypothetical protein
VGCFWREESAAAAELLCAARLRWQAYGAHDVMLWMLRAQESASLCWKRWGTRLAWRGVGRLADASTAAAAQGYRGKR